MKSASEQENIRRYLLGQLSAQDLPELEERLMVDGESYEELSISEDELIDDYLSGELSTADRESFESHFMLAPERHEKVRFARALKKFVSVVGARQREPVNVDEEPLEDRFTVAEPAPKKRLFFSFLPFQNPIVSYALAVAVLLIVGGVSWVVWKNWNPSKPGKVLAIELAPGSMTRDGSGEEERKFTIPADTGTVSLQLHLPEGEYSSYEAVLLDADLSSVSTVKDLKPQSVNGRPSTFLEVSPSLLRLGDYRVKLSGVSAGGNVERVATYSFRVEGH